MPARIRPGICRYRRSPEAEAEQVRSMRRSKNIESRFAPAEPASPVSNEHHQAMVAPRQLHPAHAQTLLGDRGAVGDALGDVHGYGAHVADAKGLWPDGRAGGRHELQL